MDSYKIEQFYENDAYCGFFEGFGAEAFEYVDYVAEHITGRVIEIGSGNGRAAYALHLRGINIMASDIYPETAKKNFSQANVEIPVEKINCNNMAAANDSVENYTFYQVLEHIPTPAKTLKEIFRTLKPGGRVVIAGPNLISPLTGLKQLIFGALGRGILLGLRLNTNIAFLLEIPSWRQFI